MKSPDRQNHQLHSYLALRNTVGLIGILLPFVLLFGFMLLFGGSRALDTISQYYYTGMRDVFVGALCAIALFMFFYRGYDRLDDITGNMAGLFALGVALFPTVESGPYNIAAWVHFICASFFFASLAAFSLFLFTRKGSDPTPRKLIRNRIYITCGLVMVICLLIIITFFCFNLDNEPDTNTVFWAETGALIAFGISWLTKGGSIFADRTAASPQPPEEEGK